MAGGCATGTWYRAGEGLIGSWIALVLYAVTAAITKTGILKPVMDKINQPTNVIVICPKQRAFRFGISRYINYNHHFSSCKNAQ